MFKDGWEYNLVLGTLFVLVAVTGPGEWSLDHALDLSDDLDGSTGLWLSSPGIVAAAVLLAVFWRPKPTEEHAA